MKTVKTLGILMILIIVIAFLAFIVSWSMMMFTTLTPQTMSLVKIGANASRVLLMLAFLIAAIAMILKPVSAAATIGKRTVRQFQINGNIAPIVEKWALENSFKLGGTVGNERTYRKGMGWTAPMMLKIKLENQTVYLETWIENSPFMRLRSLFILPKEIGIESGGVINVLDRKTARSSINLLLAQLGQPPVQ